MAEEQKPKQNNNQKIILIIVGVAAAVLIIAAALGIGNYFAIKGALTEVQNTDNTATNVNTDSKQQDNNTNTNSDNNTQNTNTKSNVNTQNNTTTNTSSTLKVGNYTLKYGTYTGIEEEYNGSTITERKATLKLRENGTYSYMVDTGVSNHGTYKVSGGKIVTDKGVPFNPKSNNTLVYEVGGGVTLNYQGD